MITVISYENELILSDNYFLSWRLRLRFTIGTGKLIYASYDYRARAHPWQVVAWAISQRPLDQNWVQNNYWLAVGAPQAIFNIYILETQPEIAFLIRFECIFYLFLIGFQTFFNLKISTKKSSKVTLLGPSFDSASEIPGQTGGEGMQNG